MLDGPSKSLKGKTVKGKSLRRKSMQTVKGSSFNKFDDDKTLRTKEGAMFTL